MVRKDGAEARKERITAIARTIQASLHKKQENNEPGELPLGRTVSTLCIDTGLTREKVMEYLQLLQDAEQFILDLKNDRIRKNV